MTLTPAVTLTPSVAVELFGHDYDYAPVDFDFPLTTIRPFAPSNGAWCSTDPADDGLPPLDTDAQQWRPVPHDVNVFDGGGQPSVNSVVAGGPGVVAVGSVQDGEAAAVWTSPDGLSWQRVPHDEAVFGNGAMVSVVAGGPGFVAVGSEGPRAAVWTSTDGVAWQRVPHDETVFSGNGRQWMTSLTVGGPGLVAVGRDFGSSAAAVWTSADGFVWQRVPHDEAVFGNSSMRSVVAGGPGLVAVGVDEARGAAGVWTSTSNLSWQRLPHEEALLGGDGNQWMESVTVGGPGLVAIGGDSGRRAAAVWPSP